jgi:transcriptional regulator with XRE-family HTH domain
MKDSILAAFWEALNHCYAEGEFPTQEALASKSGLSRTTINQQLKRTKSSSRHVQHKIAEAFGYDLIDFLALGKSLLAQRNNSSHRDGRPIPALPAQNTRKGVLELYLESNPTTEPEVLQCGKTWYLADKLPKTLGRECWNCI